MRRRRLSWRHAGATANRDLDRTVASRENASFLVAAAHTCRLASNHAFDPPLTSEQQTPLFLIEMLPYFSIFRQIIDI